jgi:hypothetical protein
MNTGVVVLFVYNKCSWRVGAFVQIDADTGGTPDPVSAFIYAWCDACDVCSLDAQRDYRIPWCILNFWDVYPESPSWPSASSFWPSDRGRAPAAVEEEVALGWDSKVPAVVLAVPV